jgi:hypothetical protein
MISKPAMVIAADQNHLKPYIGRIMRLTAL